MNKNTQWMLGIAVLIGVAAGTALFLFWEQQGKKELPPTNAPQLDLDNPGSQSDFPVSASTSELG